MVAGPVGHAPKQVQKVARAVIAFIFGQDLSEQ